MAAPIFVGTAAASIYTNPLSGAVGTGADIVVGIARTQGGGPLAAISATYAAAAMDSVQQLDWSDGTRRHALFGLTSPTTGTQNYAVSSTDTVRGLGFGSYSTVDTTDPYGTPATNTGTSDSPSVSVSASANDVVLIALAWTGANTLDTPGGTVRVSASEDGHNVRIIEVAGDTTVNWSGTFSASADWGVIGVALQGASFAETLTIDSQPSTATSGEAMANIVVESSDTASTATVTATIASGSGSLSGTTSVAMVAGVATFSNLIITGTGAHTLAFNATGHDEVVSSTITVSAPPAEPRLIVEFFRPS
jgi:hypothetical protein